MIKICHSCNKTPSKNDKMVGFYCANCHTKDNIGEKDKWKDAYYAQKEATAKVAWEVPNPYYIKDIPMNVLKMYHDLYIQKLEEYHNIKPKKDA